MSEQAKQWPRGSGSGRRTDASSLRDQQLQIAVSTRQGKERGVGRCLPTGLTKDRAAAGEVSTHDHRLSRGVGGERVLALGHRDWRWSHVCRLHAQAPCLGHLVCGTRPAPFSLGLTQRVAPSEGLNRALCMGVQACGEPARHWPLGRDASLNPTNFILTTQKVDCFSFPFYTPILTLFTQNSSGLSQWAPQNSSQVHIWVDTLPESASDSAVSAESC